MLRSLLLVIDRETRPPVLIAKLEDLLERVDPLVELLGTSEARPRLQEALDRLEALDVRVGRTALRPGPAGVSVLRWLEENRVRPVVVLEGLPPRALLDGLSTPLLILAGNQEPLSLREVVVACDDAPASAAVTLSGLCRRAGSDVRLLQEGRATPQLENARRRLEASGASTLIQRWSGEPRPEAILAETANADLVVLGAERAKEPLLSTLLSERPVLVLPTPASARSQACA